MFSKFELKLAYGLAIWLLLVGVICYAAFPPETPDQPIRLLYTPAAGKVLFDHQTHQSPTGYGISCGDCHHTLAEDEYDRPNPVLNAMIRMRVMKKSPNGVMPSTRSVPGVTRLLAAVRLKKTALPVM
jgi:hypothetical protein